MSSSPPVPAATRRPATYQSYKGALLRFRVMAIVTGVGLILLVFLAVPLQIWAGIDGPASVIGTAHGFLYMAYLVTVLDLGVRMRWNIVRLLLVAVAGTIPFLSFVAEHKITQLAKGRQSAES